MVMITSEPRRGHDLLISRFSFGEKISCLTDPNSIFFSRFSILVVKITINTTARRINDFPGIIRSINHCMVLTANNCDKRHHSYTILPILSCLMMIFWTYEVISSYMKRLNDACMQVLTVIRKVFLIILELKKPMLWWQQKKKWKLYFENRFLCISVSVCPLHYIGN